MIENVIDDRLESLPEKGPETEKEFDGFTKWFIQTFPIDFATWSTTPDKISVPELREQLIKALREAYGQREAEMGEGQMRTLERLLLLDRIDSHWKDHLHDIDYIEEGIHLRGYGGKDPIVVFKNEAFGVFEAMYQRIEEETSEYIFKARLDLEAPRRTVPQRTSRQSGAPRGRRFASGKPGETPVSAEFATQEAMGSLPKVGRNDPCPCGGGRKYKKCHGK